MVQVDSTQARRNTCPKSRTRGAFDLREDWVKEVRDNGIVETQYVHTDSNLADMFTKSCQFGSFNNLSTPSSVFNLFRFWRGKCI